MTNSKSVKFNVVEVLVGLGYTESGVKSQKTTLLKAVLNTELTIEVKDIEEVGQEELVKMLSIVMNRKSGRAELKENAKAKLLELGQDIESLTEKAKASVKKAPNCKDLNVMIKTLKEELSKAIKRITELEAK